MLLQRATDYLEAVYGPRLSGVEESIALSSALERATYAAALHEAQHPGSLNAAVTAAASVKREKVDTLEVEYFEGSGDAITDATVKISGVEGLLSPFFYVPLPAVFVV
ncbi:DnaT-like ssDNA-binding protein [uncultured Brevundimonas sp.]|uniref:DnaT-like ssDNA-binding protein n=1 Tax=uncultured Brevundimonas sp. TaxID=213418 RepID=UPI0025E9BEE7|nr:DnaT-like ssDNA-binding protein [uncultured Brevundimonas sp.]